VGFPRLVKLALQVLAATDDRPPNIEDVAILREFAPELEALSNVELASELVARFRALGRYGRFSKAGRPFEPYRKEIMDVFRASGASGGKGPREQIL
jgi:hypothetical protein